MAAPNVVATSSGNNGDIPGTTDCVVSLPAGVEADDLLLVFFSLNRTTGESASTPSGWTLVKTDGTTNIRGHVFARVAAGAESTVTVTLSAAGYASWVCYRYGGPLLSLTSVEAASANSAGEQSQADAPELAPSWGSAECSWIWYAASGGNNYNVDTWPTGWAGDQLDLDSGNTSRPATTSVATKDATDSSQDPDSSTWQFGVNKYWAAFTLAVTVNGVVFAPDPIGAEAGFQAAVAFEVGGDVGLFPKAFGPEAGFQPGISFRSGGTRQVMLTGGGIETPEMTTGGTEGDVLTQHAGSPPTWEPPGAGGTDGSLYIDLDVSGAHTVDRDDGATHDLTLTGDATFTLAGAVTSEATDLRLILRQDGTGGWEVTWPGSVVWADGTEPVLQTDPNAIDTIGLLTVDDGTTWFGYHVEAAGTAGTPATTVTDETTWGITPAVGSDTEYARQDHTHGSPAEPTAGGFAPILIADDHSTPLIFADLLQTEDGDDLLYFDGG